jgi:hypothetical protein
LAITYENILRGIKAEQAKVLEKKTMQWYLMQIRDLTEKVHKNIPTRATTAAARATGKDRLEDSTQSTQSNYSTSLAGKMLFYNYDPKHKATLPYYDIFPLVFPLMPSANSPRGSFLGLNLHYLPYYERARLMQSLYNLINSKDVNPKSKLELEYKILQGASKYRLFRPCLKRYLTSHIHSRIQIIEPEQWNYVLMLPVARFMKASELKVWSDSIKSVQKRKEKTRKEQRKQTKSRTR